MGWQRESLHARGQRVHFRGRGNQECGADQRRIPGVAESKVGVTAKLQSCKTVVATHAPPVTILLTLWDEQAWVCQPGRSPF